MTIQSNSRWHPIGFNTRVLLGLWSVFLLSGFAVAISLTPDPQGYGTHRTLGLPPCSFRLLLDIPCPSCGMTTSFAHFVRGQFLRSFSVNAGGFVLAVLCAVQIPWCWYSITIKRLWRIREPDRALIWMLLAVFLASSLNWAYRLGFGDANWSGFFNAN